MLFYLVLFLAFLRLLSNRSRDRFLRSMTLVLMDASTLLKLLRRLSEYVLLLLQCKINSITSRKAQSQGCFDWSWVFTSPFTKELKDRRSLVNMIPRYVFCYSVAMPEDEESDPETSAEGTDPPADDNKNVEDTGKNVELSTDATSTLRKRKPESPPETKTETLSPVKRMKYLEAKLESISLDSEMSGEVLVQTDVVSQSESGEEKPSDLSRDYAQSSDSIKVCSTVQPEGLKPPGFSEVSEEPEKTPVSSSSIGKEMPVSDNPLLIPEAQLRIEDLGETSYRSGLSDDDVLSGHENETLSESPVQYDTLRNLTLSEDGRLGFLSLQDTNFFLRGLYQFASMQNEVLRQQLELESKYGSEISDLGTSSGASSNIPERRNQPTLLGVDTSKVGKDEIDRHALERSIRLTVMEILRSQQSEPESVASTSSTDPSQQRPTVIRSGSSSSVASGPKDSNKKVVFTPSAKKEIFPGSITITSGEDREDPKKDDRYQKRFYRFQRECLATETPTLDITPSQSSSRPLPSNREGAAIDGERQLESASDALSEMGSIHVPSGASLSDILNIENTSSDSQEGNGTLLGVTGLGVMPFGRRAFPMYAGVTFCLELAYIWQDRTDMVTIDLRDARNDPRVVGDSERRLCIQPVFRVVNCIPYDSGSEDFSIEEYHAQIRCFERECIDKWADPLGLQDYRAFILFTVLPFRRNMLPDDDYELVGDDLVRVGAANIERSGNATGDHQPTSKHVREDSSSRSLVEPSRGDSRDASEASGSSGAVPDVSHSQPRILDVSRSFEQLLPQEWGMNLSSDLRIAGILTHTDVKFYPRSSEDSSGSSESSRESLGSVSPLSQDPEGSKTKLPAAGSSRTEAKGQELEDCRVRESRDCGASAEMCPENPDSVVAPEETGPDRKPEI